MTASPYSDRVRRLFAEPEHAGRIDGAVQSRLDAQGVRLCLSAEASGGTLRALRFLAYGCPHVIAAAEAFCEDFEGRPAAALLEFSAADLMQSLGIPREKTGRILVLEDAVRMLGSSLRDASGS